MSDRDHKIWARPEVVLREEDDGAFLFDPDSGRLCYLNQVGISIWKMCGQPINRTDIVHNICAEFPEIPEKQVSDDCAVFLGDLDRFGFIAR